MRKLFTMFGAVLMLGSVTANAQGVADEEEPGQAITVWTSYWDEEEYESMEMKDYDTVLIKNEDGSYTIEDFFNSGIPASFTFEENSSSFMKPLHMCGNIWNDPERPGMPFLMTSSDFTVGSEGYPVNEFDYMTSYAHYLDGAVTTINMTFVDETSNYVSYVMVLDPLCTAFITLSGADANGNELPEFYMQFEFDLSYWDNSGVKNVEDNSNAPAEYYNVNGVRVSDPSNGIFIRKQGSEVKKVIIRK